MLPLPSVQCSPPSSAVATLASAKAWRRAWAGGRKGEEQGGLARVSSGRQSTAITRTHTGTSDGTMSRHETRWIGSSTKRRVQDDETRDLTFQLAVTRTKKDDGVAGRRARTNDSNAISTWMLIELPTLGAAEPPFSSSRPDIGDAD